MPSIGARRAAPCVSAAVTPASVGSHHAGDIVAAPCASAAVTLASVGSHHAGDIVLAVVFYNVGVLNIEVSGKNWKKQTLTGKAAKLKCEIDAMFASDHGIECLNAPEAPPFVDWRQEK